MTFVVLGGTVVFILMARPLYSATALLRVDGATDLLAAGGAVPARSTALEDAAAMARSPAVLARVAGSAALSGDPDLSLDRAAAGPPQDQGTNATSVGKAPPDLIDRLQQAVSAEPRANGATLALTAMAQRPELAARLANGVAAALIAEDRVLRVASITEARDIARKRLADASASEAQAEAAIDQLIAATMTSEATSTSPLDRVGDQLRLAATGSDAVAAPARAALPAATRAKLDGLMQAARTAREQHQLLVAADARLTAEADLQGAAIVVTAPALPPASPIWPNWRLIMTLGALAGLTLGVCLAFLRDSLSGAFLSPGSLQAAAGLPVATVLPRLDRSAARNSGGPADAVKEAPLSRYAEAIRRLPIAIELAARRDQQTTLPAEAGGPVILVASTVDGEGKSTLALALARAYASAGRPPLLIDGNLREPGLHRLLGFVPAVGLSDYLHAALDGGNGPDIRTLFADDLLSESRIVVGAQSSVGPTDHLIAAAPFRRLVDIARGHFAMTIIDSASLTSATDAMYLAQLADVIVFVVGSSASRHDVCAALDRLAAAKPAAAGIVLVLNPAPSMEWPAALPVPRLHRQLGQLLRK